MLSCFHLIPERSGQTDGQMDRQTDGQICYINIVRQLLTRDTKCKVVHLGHSVR